MGIGWTVNFGNPWSWVPLIAVAIIVVIGPMVVHGISHSVTRPLLGSRTVAANPGAGGASPGTEESLRRYIVSLEHGRPNYDEMAPQLAAAVNRQLPKIMSTIDGLGEFKSLTYEGTDRTERTFTLPRLLEVGLSGMSDLSPMVRSPIETFAHYLD